MNKNVYANKFIIIACILFGSLCLLVDHVVIGTILASFFYLIGFVVAIVLIVRELGEVKELVAIQEKTEKYRKDTHKRKHD